MWIFTDGTEKLNALMADIKKNAQHSIHDWILACTDHIVQIFELKRKAGEGVGSAVVYDLWLKGTKVYAFE